MRFRTRNRRRFRRSPFSRRRLTRGRLSRSPFVRRRGSYKFNARGTRSSSASPIANRTRSKTQLVPEERLNARIAELNTTKYSDVKGEVNNDIAHLNDVIRRLNDVEPSKYHNIQRTRNQAGRKKVRVKRGSSPPMDFGRDIFKWAKNPYKKQDEGVNSA